MRRGEEGESRGESGAQGRQLLDGCIKPRKLLGRFIGAKVEANCLGAAVYQRYPARSGSAHGDLPLALTDFLLRRRREEKSSDRI